jgi:hypothetical protein
VPVLAIGELAPLVLAGTDLEAVGDVLAVSESVDVAVLVDDGEAADGDADDGRVDDPLPLPLPLAALVGDGVADSDAVVAVVDVGESADDSESGADAE